MYRKLLITISMIVSLLALQVPVVHADGVRIAFVKIGEVLDRAPQAKAANKRLEREFEPRNRTLINLRKTLRSYEDRLARQNVTMSESQLRKLERDIRDTKRKIRRIQEDYREDLNIRRNEELRKLQKRVYKAIVTVANRDKYDFVLGEGVIHASKRVDITEEILKVLQEEYKNEKAAASKSTTPAKSKK